MPTAELVAGMENQYHTRPCLVVLDARRQVLRQAKGVHGVQAEVRDAVPQVSGIACRSRMLRLCPMPPSQPRPERKGYGRLRQRHAGNLLADRSANTGYTHGRLHGRHHRHPHAGCRTRRLRGQPGGGRPELCHQLRGRRAGCEVRPARCLPVLGRDVGSRARSPSTHPKVVLLKSLRKSACRLGAFESVRKPSPFGPLVEATT